MNDAPRPSSPPFFRPGTVVTGLLLGLVLLAWAGRALSRQDWHAGFQRFHPLISLESNYQPTIAEMRAIVRARCRPGQVLVVVGGNSIFQGVGQPVEKLWTRQLQALLGDGFAVVNLAFRGSSPTDGGALVAESLREEFPRQIYLANVPPFTGASPVGDLSYRFMFLDAYHKGWLLETPAREDALADYLKRTDEYPEAWELNLAARLDAWLYFRPLWNWWTLRHAATFPGPLTEEFGRAFRPRRMFPDQERDFEDIPFHERFAPRFHENEMTIARNNTAPYYEAGADGGWQPVVLERLQFRKLVNAAFPSILRARTLIVLSRNSPYYTRQLPAALQARDELAFTETLALWREAGYAATEYGDDFKDQDFGDRTHLTVRGGRKLAAKLAPEIRALAKRLGYLQP